MPRGPPLHLDLELLLLAIFLGAVLQVGVGIGFSIVAGPPMMVLLGTTVAVPVLLMLNTLVSAIAVDWRIWVAEKKTIKTAIVGCLLGVALGVVIYPYLSEQIVLILTGTLLLIGVLTTLLPHRSVAGTRGFAAISGLSGLATVWAATPGPLMVFGLIATGRSARDTRKLVQPIALVAYGVALLLHGLVDGVAFAQVSNVWAFVVATFFGSILGRVIGPLLPQHLIKNAIRIVSILACYALFRRAYLIS
ncbi:hypothetical protein FEE96_11755 [Parasedimentitalea maritima]|uniref:Probable membrane transporter protein n=1 Tax=Parasedimentitalea maritima TaxID=2578117 RepID=A0ABY2UV52_9RHOB|nr:hypothetical protein FEE96_11755 [Zongyanglinia marina]